MNPLEDFLAAKEEMEKDAGWLSSAWNAFKGGGSAFKEGMSGKGGVMRTMGATVPPAVAMLGVGAGAAGVGELIDVTKDHLRKAKDFKAMLEVTPSLKEHDAGKTQLIYNSLRRTAPTLARDPLIAGSFVRDIINMSPESGPAIPVATAKTLADTQKSIGQMRSSQSPIAEAFTRGAASGMPYQAPDSKSYVESRWEQPTGEFHTVQGQAGAQQVPIYKNVVERHAL